MWMSKVKGVSSYGISTEYNTNTHDVGHSRFTTFTLDIVALKGSQKVLSNTI